MNPSKLIPLVTACFMIFLTSLHAQKKCLYKPDRFNFVRESDLEGDFITKKADVLSKSPWYAFIDRAGLSSFDKPESRSRGKVEELTFKEAYLVVEEDKSGEWVRLVSGAIAKDNKFENGGANNKEIGWVKKENLLLWDGPLRDDRSRFPLMAFTVVTIEGLKNISDGKESVNYYNKPKGGSTVMKFPLHEFQYILKSEGGRYLVASSPTIHPSDSKLEIVGWVDQDKFKKWDNRIVLEPNFESASVEERRASESKRLRAFESVAKARKYSIGEDVESVIEGIDVVEASKAELQSTEYDKYRYKGNVMRMPLFDFGSEIYKTGVVGDLIDKSLSGVGISAERKKQLATKRSKLRNYNILIAVQANRSTAAYKEHIKSAIASIPAVLNINNRANSIKYSVVFYDDFEKSDLETKRIELSEDIGRIYQALESTSFSSPDDADLYTNMFAAIQELFLESRVDKEETNVLLILGKDGDYSANSIRRYEAAADNSLITIEELTQTVSAYNPNIFSVQLRSDDAKKPRNTFLSQTRQLIQQCAQINYDFVVSVEESAEPPYIPIVEEGTLISIDEQAMRGSLFRAEFGSVLNPPELKNSFSNELADISSFVERTYTTYVNLENDYGLNDQLSDISQGNVPYEKIKFDFMQMCVGRSRDDSKVSECTLEWERIKTLKDVKLFVDCYIPEKLNNSNSDLLSLGIMMDGKEYRDYILFLQDISRLGSKSTEEIRDELLKQFIDILASFTGQNAEDITKLDQDINQLRIIQRGLPVDIAGKTNFPLADIKNEKKVSRDLINQFLEDCRDKLNKIKLYEERGSCTSCYEFNDEKDQRRYYWIPLELAL